MSGFERQQLQDQHRRLDQEIERRRQGSWADPLEIQALKKRKLAIKDRLHQIAGAHRTAAQAA